MLLPVASAGVSAAPRPQLWRIGDRSSFQELRRHGRRARRGPLSVTWVAPAIDATPPRAGFTVGKSVGGATVRNLVKRRLRAALRELQAVDRLPGGTFVIGAGPDVVGLSYLELHVLLGDAIDAASGKASMS